MKIKTSLFTCFFALEAGFDEPPTARIQPTLKFEDGALAAPAYIIQDGRAICGDSSVVVPEKWPTVTEFCGWGFFMDMVLLRDRRSAQAIQSVHITTAMAQALFEERWLKPTYFMNADVVNFDTVQTPLGTAVKGIAVGPLQHRGTFYVLSVWASGGTGNWRWPIRVFDKERNELPLFAGINT